MATLPQTHACATSRNQASTLKFWSLPNSLLAAVLLILTVQPQHAPAQLFTLPVTSSSAIQSSSAPSTYIPSKVLVTSLTMTANTAPASTSNASDPDEGWNSSVTTYYYAFFVILVILVVLIFWFRRKRLRARKLRTVSSRQNALLQDAAGWPRQRYHQHVDGTADAEEQRHRPVAGDTYNAQARRWMPGTRLSSWSNSWGAARDSTRLSVLREDGLDERGEAPPPYKPPERDAARPGSAVHGSSSQSRRTSVAVTDLDRGVTIAREPVGKPPDYGS